MTARYARGERRSDDGDLQPGESTCTECFRLTPINDLFYIVSMQSRRNQSRTYDPLGEFETLVLMAVLQLGDDAYGMRVHRELEVRAGRKCSFGALYTTLDRLEEKGYVSSRIGEPTTERGGRAKKFFHIKALGAAALRQSYDSMRRMAEGLEPMLGGAL
jgi:PadR family transcriptional regulator, regulatory protein PadR